MRTFSERRLDARAVLLGAILLATAGSACSQEPDSPSARGVVPGQASGDLTGSVGMRLTLPSGVQLDSVSWAITEPNDASTSVKSGTVNVPSSAAIRFLVGGIPAGEDLRISLSGLTPDKSVTCAGSASFDVAARMTTNVSVALGCTTLEPDAGSAFIRAGAYDCASVLSVTANPAETTLGRPLVVSGTVTGPNTGGLTYTWSASSGSFDTPTAAEANFTCTVAGPSTLTLTATDGPVPEGGPCNPALGTMSIQVQCDPDADAGAFSDADSASSSDATPNLDVTSDAGAKPAPPGAGSAPASDGSLTAAGYTFTAEQGLLFQGPLASVSDASLTDTALDFEVILDWGDGTPDSVGKVSGGSGAFVVSGTHTYAAAGAFTVTISVTDTLNNATASATSSTVVSPGEE